MADLSTVPTRVVVPIDDSQESHRALPHAAALAEQFGAVVETVTVADPRDATAADVRLDGDPVEAVTSHVAAGPPTIVVMASHGRSAVGRRLIGSTAEAMLDASPAPVVVIGPHAVERPTTQLDTVVAGLAWSPSPERLVGLLATWAPALGAAVHLVHARSPWAAELYAQQVTGRPAPDRPDVEGVGDRLRAVGVTVEVHEVTTDDPVRGLLDIAERAGPHTMLAVESHRDGRGRGDVAYQLVRRGHCPVLVTTGVPHAHHR